MVDLLFAPFVVAARLPHLWWEAVGGNPFGRRESERMVTEKVAAFHEGLFSMQMEMMKATITIGGAVARLEPVGAVSADAMRRIVDAGIEPTSRRVRYNVSRLTRR